MNAPAIINREIEEAYKGHVVEVFVQRWGNVPAERRIARVSHVRDCDDMIVAYDPDGVRMVFGLIMINRDLGPARAGWGSW